MSEKKNIANFVSTYEKFKNDTLKENAVKSIMIDTKMGFVEKKAVAENIARACTIDAETGRFKVDNINQVLFFHLAILQKFTNLDLSEPEKYTENFDLLDHSGVLNEIVKLVPEKDYVELREFVNIAIDDATSNHYQFQGWIEEVIGSLGNVLSGLIDNMDDETKGIISNLLTTKIGN